MVKIMDAVDDVDDIATTSYPPIDGDNDNDDDAFDDIDDIFNTAYPPMVIVTMMMMPSMILMIN